ncbi:acyl-CoA dehydrogenase family protein [Novosphingobium sp. MMS21-SN21R]|uniref:acyl-CoA dehydrogenase family protein n=1 Tax=Novosphingobium sp. MMS21-SN21R TaxID=2969298 RepID=UPI002887ED90|nr:acyl-CoA dehydrogenase family protein [Novosphingobium sp. MMS21-SN21R]MDT0509797.1 acyl-CoA dehydrogenase family protein [Novosphingobium sp. MMS21-SN21R]
MDLQYSEQDREFRAKARAWLSANVPAEARPAHGHASATFDRDWQRKLYDHGWAGVSWPKEFGGLGLSGLQQVLWYEELARARAPHYINTTYVAMMHAGPTLIARGTDEQKAFHLPRILSGESLWCQGFSEPNAGSDLASLKTRGVVDGDDIVVTGAKMWTTDAQHGDYQELLIRTDPDSQRHKGLTWVICDMKTPGIDIKPIRTMLGDEHINTVFYDEVRIPIANVVGEIGQGWSTALATLSFERGLGFIGDQLELYERVGRAVDLAGKLRFDDGTLAIDDSAIAQKLASLKSDAMAIRAMTLADIAETDRTGQPGPKGSMMKLLVTNTHKALSEVVGEMMGWDFLEFNGDRSAHPWTYDFLWSWIFSISGGTNEIQRENIADRVLSLPRAR